MKPEQLYQELKDVADKLAVTVLEQSFRSSGIPVKSGFCTIKGAMHCIIDKNLSIAKKTKVLAETLSAFPHEHIYMVPAVRDVIQRYATTGSPGQPKIETRL